MGTHFISILGTSNYEPVIYDGQSVTGFAQIAIIGKFYKKLAEEGSRLTFFLTDLARSRSWEDSQYGSKDLQNMENWPESVRPRGSEKKGLLSEIQEKYPLLAAKAEAVSIPVGKSEAEIWQIFQKLYDSIGMRDEIIFDITHSFRSIPMLAMTVINYASVTKNCSLKGIYYGAYEAARKDDSGVKHAPVFDLSIYNEILKWAHAADTLERDGNPNEINHILTTRKNGMSQPEQRKWKPVTDYLSALTLMTNSLNTCRGGIVPVEEDAPVGSNAARQSISRAYQHVKDVRGSIPAMSPETDETRPLFELLEKAEKSFSGFETDQNYKTGLAAVAWYLDKNMIQQGYTALEETAKTFFCCS